MRSLGRGLRLLLVAALLAAAFEAGVAGKNPPASASDFTTDGAVVLGVMPAPFGVPAVLGSGVERASLPQAMSRTRPVAVPPPGGVTGTAGPAAVEQEGARNWVVVLGFEPVPGRAPPEAL